MPLTYGSLARVERQARPQQSYPFSAWPFGLNTSIPAFHISPKELAKLVNFKVNRGGALETRPPIVQYSNTAVAGTPEIKVFERVPIGATDYDLLIDENYEIHYLDGSLDPQSIGTLEGEATILSYLGVAVLLDGSFIKYLDDVASIKIAYDDGSGPSGYQFDNRAGDVDGSLALGNATNVRIAYKFTSQAWTAGYTIPPTRVSFKLSKTLVPAGTAVVKIRLVSDDSILASKDFIDVATLDGVATEHYVDFTASDITTELSPNVAYYASLEYAGGDAANYVNVHYTTVAAGGAAYKFIAAWSQEATKDSIVSLRPGMPPKGAFGAVHKSRIMVAGDPDNPGYMWYGNLTYLDWSTTDGGGYVGAVDENRNDYPVGGMESLYNELYVFGKEDQPYLCKLTGNSPSEYSLPPLFKGPWTTHRVLVNAINDVWYSGANGVDSLSGVQEFGDVRTYSFSDPISDRMKDYWDSDTAIAGYFPESGQYWLYMPSYHRILICNIKDPIRDEKEVLRYPWTEYELYRDIFTSGDYLWLKSCNGTNEYYIVVLTAVDYTGYVETDVGAYLTVAATQLTVTAMPANASVFISNDYGADFFCGEFEFSLDVQMVTNTEAGAGLSAWQLSDSEDSYMDIYDASGGALAVLLRRSDYTSAYHIQLLETLGGAAQSDTFNASVDTTYYLTIKRDRSVGTYGTLYCYIYSDSGRETLLDTLIITLAGNHSYRYLFGCASYYQSGGGWTREMTAVISNLKVPDDPSIATQPDFVLLDGVKITEGTAGSLAEHQWDYGDNDGLGYSTIYLRDVAGNPGTSGVEVRSVLAPTCFGAFGGDFYIGASDGLIYKVDSSEYKDLTDHRIRFVLTTAYVETPFAYINLVQQQLSANSKGGAQLDLSLSKDGFEAEFVYTWTYNLSVYDGLTVDEALMDVDDALFTLDPKVVLGWKHINVNVKSFQVTLDNILLAGYPLYINSLLFRYRQLQY